MDETVFDGSLVWEKLARIDMLEEFIAAVDSEDAPRAAVLMRRANIDREAIAMTLRKMANPDDGH